METKVLYRYEIEYSNADDPETGVRLLELPVIRETANSYFVKRFYWGGKPRRVSKTAHDTYAYNTKDKALNHFIRRTSTRIRWFEYWSSECEKAIKLAEEMRAK